MRVSETLINKKIIYSNKHISEIDVTETETNEKTYTDLIMGTKESNKHTTETEERQLQQRDKLSTNKQQSSK